MGMKNAMPIDTKSLTKEWINYLRNNQIISAPDPSGQLKYKKKITPDIVSRFCELKTDFDEQTISDAIQQVITKKTGNQPEPDQEQEKEKAGAAAFGQMGKQLGARSPQPTQPTNEAAPLSQNPGAVRKREQRAATAQASKAGAGAFGQMGKQLGAAGAAEPKAVEFNEKDVAALFDILAAKDPSAAQAAPTQASAPAQAAPADPVAEKQDKIKRLKRLVRDEMTPEQRKALWRALNESVIFEAQIEPADVKAVFKDAYKLRDASTKGFKGAMNTSLGKINKGLRKDKIDINDLQQAWKDAGYPDDTRDIEQLLKAQGFGQSEIQKIFSNTFGDNTGHEDNSVSSPASIKIADYAKNNGLKDELVAFMQQEFGQELGITKDRGLVGKAMDYGKKVFGRKATTEEVRQIFTVIVNEDRTERHSLIREEELKFLGRRRRF
jgi:hypothetical protein